MLWGLSLDQTDNSLRYIDALGNERRLCSVNHDVRTRVELLIISRPDFLPEAPRHFSSEHGTKVTSIPSPHPNTLWSVATET